MANLKKTNWEEQQVQNGGEQKPSNRHDNISEDTLAIFYLKNRDAHYCYMIEKDTTFQMH